MIEKIIDFLMKLIMVLILISLLIILYKTAKEKKQYEPVGFEERKYAYILPEWQKGFITYYHSRFHGRITKYNEIYDKNGFTCASNVLPYKSIVLFLNPKNLKVCFGIVNDTGSFKKVDFDVSERIAKELDILKEGKAEVLYLVLGTIDEIAGNCIEYTN